MTARTNRAGAVGGLNNPQAQAGLAVKQRETRLDQINERSIDRVNQADAIAERLEALQNRALGEPVRASEAVDRPTGAGICGGIEDHLEQLALVLRRIEAATEALEQLA